jgi:nitroreductase
VDPFIALSFLDVAAPALGLGTCWAGYLMAAIPQSPPLKEALGLSEAVTSLAAMMVGYPKYRYHRLPPRNEPQIAWRE